MSKGAHLGELEYLVLLATARLEDTAYGMTIHDEIRRTTGRDISIPTVYVTLTRLEAKRCVSSYAGRVGESTTARAKKMYRLTKAGAKALVHARDMAARLWQGVSVEKYL